MPRRTSQASRDATAFPFVRFGDEPTLVLRVCDGKESAPGAAGLRLLVAARLSR